MSDPHGERRGGTRKPAHFVAEIEVEGEPAGCAVSRDASTAGLLLLTQSAIEPGKPVLLRLWTTAEEGPRAIAGSVVRCEKLPLGRSGLWTHRVAISIRDRPSDFEQLIDTLADR